jgi:copper chaperone CopZ
MARKACLSNEEGDTLVVSSLANETHITCAQNGSARTSKFVTSDPDDQKAIVQALNDAREQQPK